MTLPITNSYIYVTEVAGQGQNCSIGKIIPASGMQTNYGLVTAVSGDWLHITSGYKSAGGGDLWIYDYFCSVASGTLGPTFAFPTGVNCLLNDQSILRPNSGLPFNVNRATGTTYSVGNAAPVSYGRGNNSI